MIHIFDAMKDQLKDTRYWCRNISEHTAINALKYSAIVNFFRSKKNRKWLRQIQTWFKEINDNIAKKSVNFPELITFHFDENCYLLLICLYTAIFYVKDKLSSLQAKLLIEFRFISGFCFNLMRLSLLTSLERGNHPWQFHLPAETGPHFPALVRMESQKKFWQKEFNIKFNQFSARQGIKYGIVF